MNNLSLKKKHIISKQRMRKRYNQQRNPTQRQEDTERVRIFTNQSELHLQSATKPDNYRPFSNVGMESWEAAKQ